MWWTCGEYVYVFRWTNYGYAVPSKGNLRKLQDICLKTSHSAAFAGTPPKLKETWPITKWHAYSHSSVSMMGSTTRIDMPCYGVFWPIWQQFTMSLQCLWMSYVPGSTGSMNFHEFSMFVSHCWHFEAVRSRPFARSLAECRAQLDHLASTFTMKLQLFLRALEEKRRNGRRKLQFSVKHVKHK